MGLAGRRRRLRNFDLRAKQFKNAVERTPLTTSKEIIRDTRRARVGTGQHKRLILKNTLPHAKIADKLTRILLSDFQVNSIKPKNFVLVQPRLSENGVQEYFNKPSILSLSNYLSNPDFKGDPMNRKTDYFLCKQFVNQKQNRGITTKQIAETMEEFNSKLDDIHDGWGRILPSNLIVLGKTKEGKLRIALVDI